VLKINKGKTTNHDFPGLDNFLSEADAMVRDLSGLCDVKLFYRFLCDSIVFAFVM
jgi:hypothetical protein